MTSISPPAPGNFLFTSESVNEGHPDKICDQVSDAILDACLAEDPDSKVACESCTKTGFVMVFGEISTKAQINYEQVVRDTVKAIGYDSEEKGLDYKTMKVNVAIEEQSSNIAEAVHVNKDINEIGAGDQGLMFGYASDETPELMPLSHSLALSLGKQLSFVRKEGILPYLRPDGKTQVTVEYKKHLDGSIEPCRVHTVLISTQHSPEVSNETIRNDLMKYVVKEVIPSKYLDSKTIFYMNPSGKFIIGGPHGDSGMTGRKIIVDTYGGWGAHGGGAFSGKDSTKVDRSAAYMARKAAKSLVSSKLCHRVLVQVAYSIGVVQPLSIFIDSFGTCTPGLDDTKLFQIVQENFDFRPGHIQKVLDLNKPIFYHTSVHGHFGRENQGFKWEIPLDLSDYLPEKQNDIYTN